MTDYYRVYEAGSGKWLFIESDLIIYSSDINDADYFHLPILNLAADKYPDFDVYGNTLHAVKVGYPWNTPLVKDLINGC